MIIDNELVSEKFNNYFSQIVNCLDLYEFPSKPRREYADEINNIVLKFKTHPSIIASLIASLITCQLSGCLVERINI